MVKRVGRGRRKSRNKLVKGKKAKGKVALAKHLVTFIAGERVILAIEPSIQKGMIPPRFHGSHGIIQNKVGFCYNVKIKDGSKEKLLSVHPVHMRKINGN